MKNSHELARQRAQECIDYYHRLLRDEAMGQNWALGLFMAKQWHRMLQEEVPDMEEIRLFSTALNNDRANGSCGGSAWHSLSLEVERWLGSL
ncbi:MAG: hypothetical protein EOP06_14830 [Proteobacteria bacterium]|nr:MAG: hypothetical protein EOP06_14830 [Pseudomonadota bacterium]